MGLEFECGGNEKSCAYAVPRQGGMQVYCEEAGDLVPAQSELGIGVERMGFGWVERIVLGVGE